MPPWSACFVTSPIASTPRHLLSPMLGCLSFRRTLHLLSRFFIMYLYFYWGIKIICLIHIHFCKIKISFRRSHDFRLGRRQLLRRRSDDEPRDGLRDFRRGAGLDVLDFLARWKDRQVLFVQHEVLLTYFLFCLFVLVQLLCGVDV